MSNQTYQLNIEINDGELSMLLHALDSYRNEYLDEIKATKKERKARKISKRNANDCKRFYRESIGSMESLQGKIDSAIPHNG